MSSSSDDEDKPLDPAVERVRRRLARFMAINLGILFLAVMAVVVAIVYKLNQLEPSRPEVAQSLQPPSGEAPIEARIALPAGSRLNGHEVSGDRLSLDVGLAEGGRAIFVYDMAERRMVGRFDIAVEP